MKILKYICAFGIPILIVIAIWRSLNLGDNYSFKGFKFAFEYASTFPGFAHTYEVITNISTYFTFGWADVIGAILAAPFFIAKMVFCICYLLFGLVNDIVRIVIWSFSWITNMAT